MKEMKKLYVLIILLVGWNLTSCSSPSPVKTNVEGVLVSSQEEEMDSYLTRLNNLISDHTLLMTTQDVVLPPKFDISTIIKEDKLPSGNSITYVILKNGNTISFADSTSPEREDGNMEYWTVRAYDINNNVLYILKNQSYGFYDFIGVSLNTGNQFEVYCGNTAGDNEWMYEHKFSPDMKYLLRAGNLYPNEYGWSVVNLSNGVELKKLYKQYVEFISEPWWKRDDSFRISYDRIPYVTGLEYTDDYKFYLQLKGGEAIRWSMLSTYEFITKEQIFNLKGEQVSEKILKTSKIELK
jgi:hypothetical protein